MKKGILRTILRMRNRHLFAMDVVVLSVIPLASFVVRMNAMSDVVTFALPLAIFTLSSLVIKLSVFNVFHFYNRLWRYATLDELATLGYATLASGIFCIILFFAVLKPTGLIPGDFPRLVPFIDAILTMLIVGGIRFSLRIFYRFNARENIAAHAERVRRAAAQRDDAA